MAQPVLVVRGYTGPLDIRTYHELCSLSVQGENHVQSRDPRSRRVGLVVVVRRYGLHLVAGVQQPIRVTSPVGTGGGPVENRHSRRRGALGGGLEQHPSPLWVTTRNHP